MSTIKPIDLWWNCPTCKEESTGSCRCLRSDSYCGQGHEWHYYVFKDAAGIMQQEIHDGGSNHGSDICCHEPKVLGTRDIPERKRDAS